MGMDHVARAEEYAQHEITAAREIFNAATQRREAEYELSKLEAWFVTGGLDGKNAEERKANLVLLLDGEPTAVTLRQRIEEATQAQAKAEADARFASRMYHLHLAQLQRKEE